MRRAVLFVAATAAIAAPGLFACGLTADFSGLQGAPLVDAAPRDAALADSHPAEGAPPPDVSQVDAAPFDAPSEVSLGFCASLPVAPRLCADFDEGAPLETGWTLLDVYAGQTARVDSTAFSPPGAFLSQINRGNAPSSARLQQAVPTLSPHVHVAFAMLVEPSDGSFELAAIHEVTGEGATYGLFYKEEGRKLLTYLKTLNPDGGTTNLVHTLDAPPAGWLHVEIDMDIADSGTLVVKHDGVVVVNDVNVPTSTPSRAQLFVELGYYSTNAASGTTRFDDVIVDWP